MAFKAIPLILILILLVAACRTPGKNKDIKPREQERFITFPDAPVYLAGWPVNNDLIIHLPGDPGNIHPTNFTHANSRMLMYFTHCFLAVVNLQTPEVVPQLVKSLPEISSNELEFTYEILEEAIWDDGTPVSAMDVLFTVKAAKCPLLANPNIKPYVENISEVRLDPVNPQKFTFIMKRRYIQNISFVTDLAILSRRFYDPENILSDYSLSQFDDPDFNAGEAPDLYRWSIGMNDGKMGNDPAFTIGCGPYRLVKWDAGQSIVFEKKQGHWTERLKNDNLYLHAYPQRIIVKFVSDENAMMLEAKSQSIDVSTYFPTKTLATLQSDSNFNRNYNSAYLKSYTMNVLYLNMKPDGLQRLRIFDDIRVRKAMAHLTPVDQIIRIITLGRSQPLTSVVSPIRNDYNTELKRIPFDPAAAGMLLDEAGWKDSDGDGIRDRIIDGKPVPLEIEFTYGVQSTITQDLANLVSEAALQGGVKIIQKPVDAGLLRQLARDHDFDMLLLGWNSNSLNIDFTQLWHTSSWGNNGSNFSGFGNAASDALIDSVKYTLNDSLYTVLSKRFQKMVYDEQPVIFLYSTYRKVLIHKRWGNQIMSSEFPSVIPQHLKLLAPSTVALLQD